MNRRCLYQLSGIVIIVVMLAGCTGQMGPAGPVGPAGPPGPLGPVGPAGENASASQLYVGSERCGQCHEDQFARFSLSGHPYVLTKIESGAAPAFPHDAVTGGVADPPAGYTWDDISYVVGGFVWQARFVDERGYLITGEGEDETQYNFANEFVDKPAGWAAYHPGEIIPFDCGRCHTTGYRTEGHQDDLEGVAGTWEFEGVQCEACHGPGSGHAADPQGIAMPIDRSAQMCGDCHAPGDPAVITAADGFEHDAQQYADFYNSKHFALTCVACHDPHETVVHAAETEDAGAGPDDRCVACHFQNVRQNVDRHLRVTCVDCHMPRMALSAQGDLAQFRADVHSHQFAIDTDPAAPQFSEDGTVVMPYLTLQYACGQCHNDAYVAMLEPEVAAAAAETYHDMPTPTPTATPEPAPELTGTPSP